MPAELFRKQLVQRGVGRLRTFLKLKTHFELIGVDVVLLGLRLGLGRKHLDALVEFNLDVFVDLPCPLRCGNDGLVDVFPFLVEEFKIDRFDSHTSCSLF